MVDEKELVGFLNCSAMQYYLVKDSFFRADKAPLESLLFAVGELDRQTNVEQLTVVVHIRVVAVDPRLAGECVRDVGADGRRVAGQAECLFGTGGLSCHLEQRVRLYSGSAPFYLGRAQTFVVLHSPSKQMLI